MLLRLYSMRALFFFLVNCHFILPLCVLTNIDVRAAEFFPHRSEVQCLHRWQKVLNPDLVKGPWTPEVGHFISIRLSCNCLRYSHHQLMFITLLLSCRRMRKSQNQQLNTDLQNGLLQQDRCQVELGSSAVRGNMNILPHTINNFLKCSMGRSMSD